LGASHRGPCTGAHSDMTDTAPDRQIFVNACARAHELRGASLETLVPSPKTLVVLNEGEDTNTVCTLTSIFGARREGEGTYTVCILTASTQILYAPAQVRLQTKTCLYPLRGLGRAGWAPQVSTSRYCAQERHPHALPITLLMEI